VTLIADVRIRGVWQSQVDALFDIWVVDKDAPSYQFRSPQAVLRTAEVEKCVAGQAHHTSLTPLCFSVVGLCGSARLIIFYTALQIFYQLNGIRIIVGVYEVKIVICNPLLCAWGSRTKWRSLGLVIDEISHD